MLTKPAKGTILDIRIAYTGKLRRNSGIGAAIPAGRAAASKKLQNEPKIGVSIAPDFGSQLSWRPKIGLTSRQSAHAKNYETNPAVRRACRFSRIYLIRLCHFGLTAAKSARKSSSMTASTVRTFFAKSADSARPNLSVLQVLALLA
jgi:hypothetical protein